MSIWTICLGKNRGRSKIAAGGPMIIDGSRAADRTSALILRFYSAYNRRDIDGMLDCVNDDVVHDLNQGQREVGKAALRAYLQRILRCYSEEVRDIVVL